MIFEYPHSLARTIFPFASENMSLLEVSFEPRYTKLFATFSFSCCRTCTFITFQFRKICSRHKCRHNISIKSRWTLKSYTISLSSPCGCWNSCMIVTKLFKHLIFLTQTIRYWTDTTAKNTFHIVHQLIFLFFSRSEFSLF